MEQFQVSSKVKSVSWFLVWLLSVLALAWVFFSYIHLQESRLSLPSAFSRLNRVEICPGPCFTGIYPVFQGIRMYRNQ